MANGLAKKVVFRKPKISERVVDLRARAEDPIKVKPERKFKSPERSKPEPPKPVEEPTLEISEEPEEIIQTKSKRTIIARREPQKPKEVTVTDTFVIDDSPKSKSFDEKFLDQLGIKSKITKDEKTLEKLSKPELKPTIKSKQKRKRKIKLSTVVSLILFIGISLWTYKLTNDYLSGNFDTSLASFMYIIATGLLAVIIFVWFIIELIMEDKR